MVEKLKRNLEYVFCAGLGFLNFILFAFPYAASFWKYDLGSWGGKQSGSEGISGYELLKLWDGGFGGVMSSLVQLIIFLGGLGLLAFGVCGLLKEFGILPKFPDQIGSFKSKELGELALFGMAGLQALLLVFLIILSIANTERESEYGYTSEAGIRLSAGIFIALLLYVGAVACLILLRKKMPTAAVTESVSYVCSGCGKRAKASDKFCNACGGAIEKRVSLPTEYVCEACGAKASASDKFCRGCGGAVVQREVKPTEQPQPTEDRSQPTEAT